MDAKYMPHINKYILYLKRTWLDDDALFHISEWSVDESLTERTTNVAEGERDFPIMKRLTFQLIFENFEKFSNFQIFEFLKNLNKKIKTQVSTIDII